ncbi:MAG: DUF4878 domain-containing protein [Spirulinaceae cyanobacterium]
MKRRRFLTISILSLTATIITSCSLKSGPGATVEEFHYAIEKGEIEAATNLFSNSVIESFGKDKIKAGMSQAVRNLQDKQGIESIKIMEEEVTGEVAQVSYKITYGDATEEDNTAQLIKEDGEWKIEPSK